MNLWSMHRVLHLNNVPKVLLPLLETHFGKCNRPNKRSNKVISSRILTLEKLGAIFNQEIRKLKLTPRRLIVHPEMNWLYMIESDHVSYTEISKQQKREQIAKVSFILPRREIEESNRMSFDL